LAKGTKEAPNVVCLLLFVRHPLLPGRITCLQASLRKRKRVETGQLKEKDKEKEKNISYGPGRTGQARERDIHKTLGLPFSAALAFSTCSFTVEGFQTLFGMVAMVARKLES
jgi:hypothetical protein